MQREGAPTRGYRTAVEQGEVPSGKLRNYRKQRKIDQDEPLPFVLVGGKETGYGVFVAAVDADSAAEKAGVRKGDEVRRSYKIQ